MAAITGCKKEEITVTPELKLEPNTGITFPAAGGDKVITVVTNMDTWSVKSDMEWCVVREADDTSFYVSAAANDSEEPRQQATVTVTAGTGPSAVEATLKVNQLGATESVVPFTIQLTQLTSSSVTMYVVPADLKAPYYYDVIEKSVLDEHHNSDVAVLMENMMNEAESMYGSMEEAVAQLSSTGIVEYEFTRLVPDRDYVAFAAGLGSDGKVNTDIVQTSFHTEQGATGVSFNVYFTEYYYNGVDYRIVPSDETFTYYNCIRPAFGYEDMSDEELRETIIAEDSFMIDFYATSGTYEYTNEEVWFSDTGYMVLVFGWSDGVPTSDIYRFPFRTAAPETPSTQCEFNVRFENITSRSASVYISTADPAHVYMWDLISAADYEAYRADMESYVEAYVNSDIDNLDYNRVMGESGYIFSRELDPGTEYYVWAACISDTGALASDVFVSEPFSTLPEQVSSATVTAEIVRYFNGDDLYALDPVMYAAGQGKAYVEVTFTATSDASTWFGTMVKEDPADHTDNISDAEIAATLQASGEWYPTQKVYWCDWDAEYTVLAVAIGNDDNLGPVFRLSDTFTRDGASSINDFGIMPAGVDEATPLPAYTPSVKVYRTAPAR